MEPPLVNVSTRVRTDVQSAQEPEEEGDLQLGKVQPPHAPPPRVGAYLPVPGLCWGLPLPERSVPFSFVLILVLRDIHNVSSHTVHAIM